MVTINEQILNDAAITYRYGGVVGSYFRIFQWVVYLMFANLLAWSYVMVNHMILDVSANQGFVGFLPRVMRYSAFATVIYNLMLYY